MNNIEELAKKMAEQMLADMLKKQQASAVTVIQIKDDRLQRSVDTFLKRLEAFFPEHKVFALDSIDKKSRERLSDLYKKIGYKTADDMLAAYGYEIISGDAVKELRSFVMYTPGNEPDIIKSKVTNMLNRLNEYYPDHIIPRGLQNDHKNLSKTISGLYQWLGYDSAGEMLTAYGYQYNVAEGGRPSNDYEELINLLVEKYKDIPKPKNMGELIFDNPEHKGALKTLQNKANEVFGMSLKKYFDQLGLFAGRAGGTTYAPRAVSQDKKEAAVEALRDRYESLITKTYGSIDDALNNLNGINFKQNKRGQIYVFRAATIAEEVTIPYGIDFISAGAFFGQSVLEKVTILAPIAEIDSCTFANCANLTSVVLPEGILSIGEKAFANCTSLKSIIFPKSLQQIADNAFQNCSSLESVEFKNARTTVAANSFDGCLYQHTVEVDVASTDYSMFSYTADRKGYITITGYRGKDEEIIIPGMIEGHPVTIIGKGAFQGNQHIVSVAMSDYITTIQGDAFRDCISLKKLHLSNSISKLVTTTFSGCISLQELNIPDMVTEIKRATLKDCPLKNLHIGKALNIIDSRPFYQGKHDAYSGKVKSTRAINRVTIDPSNPYMTANESMVFSADGRTLLAVLGNARAYTIPEGVEVISDYAFENLAFLSDITIPESLITIGEKAFSGTGIRSIILGSNVKEIKAAAFCSCNNLTAAVFNDGLEIIGSRAFEGCPIASVSLPATVKDLGEYSFSCISGYYGSGHRQSLRIHPANPYLKSDGEALYVMSDSEKTLQVMYSQKYRQYVYDHHIKNIEYCVADGTTHISNGAFARCTSLNKVVLPESLLVIGESAFVDCQSLKEINIPQHTTTIGANAFKGTEIKKFVLPATISEIGTSAFITGYLWNDQRTKLRDIKVDKNNRYFFTQDKALYKIKSDGTWALMVYFGEDETVVLPDNTSEICESAFMGSIAQEVHIPASVVNIGENAFSKCHKLTRLKVHYNMQTSDISYAVVYMPETKGEQGLFADTSIRDQYMDCIRIDGDGKVFDFVKYDSLFETISSSKDKILVATDRLKSAFHLVPLYRDKYLSYLRRNAQKAVQIVVEFDDLSGLNTLAELNVFTGKNIDAVIELANKAQKSEILSYLMNFKNSKIGITEENYDL